MKPHEHLSLFTAQDSDVWEVRALLQAPIVSNLGELAVLVHSFSSYGHPKSRVLFSWVF